MNLLRFIYLRFNYVFIVRIVGRRLKAEVKNAVGFIWECDEAATVRQSSCLFRLYIAIIQSNRFFNSLILALFIIIIIAGELFHRF